jgi:hypothetical protein
MAKESMTGGDPAGFSLDRMRSEIAGGTNKYTVIGSALRAEAQRLFALHAGVSPSSGQIQTDHGQVGLSALSVSKSDVSSTLFDVTKLGHIAGFSYIAQQLYPRIIDWRRQKIKIR